MTSGRGYDVNPDMSGFYKTNWKIYDYKYEWETSSAARKCRSVCLQTDEGLVVCIAAKDGKGGLILGIALRSLRSCSVRWVISSLSLCVLKSKLSLGSGKSRLLSFLHVLTDYINSFKVLTNAIQQEQLQHEQCSQRCVHWKFLRGAHLRHLKKMAKQGEFVWPKRRQFVFWKDLEERYLGKQAQGLLFLHICPDQCLFPFE